MSANFRIESDAARRAGAAADAAREYLNFRLGDEEYGIDILRVQEIRSYEVPTRIAGAAGFMRGVLDLRGVIVPVVDLRLRFDLEARFDELTVTVVLNVAGRTVAAVVDSVSDVLELTPAQIKPMPTCNSSIDALHVIGMASIVTDETERAILLLDIEPLMLSPDMGLHVPSPTAMATTLQSADPVIRSQIGVPEYL